MALAAANGDAEYALGLVVAYMRDESLSQSFRKACAVEVMDRVWGKPKQRTEVSGEDGGPVVMVWDDTRDPLPPFASGPAGSME